MVTSSIPRLTLFVWAVNTLYLYPLVYLLDRTSYVLSLVHKTTDLSLEMTGKNTVVALATAISTVNANFDTVTDSTSVVSLRSSANSISPSSLAREDIGRLMSSNMVILFAVVLGIFSLAFGTAGLYCWRNQQSHSETMRAIQSRAEPPVTSASSERLIRPDV